MRRIFLLLALTIFFLNCKEKEEKLMIKQTETPFFWEGANIYFLLTDRFNNGDPSNDINFNRTEETGKLRGF